jgi:hypothetical protein
VCSSDLARVVARGGLLAAEVTVCTADEALSIGRAQYFGRDTIAPSVSDALAAFECRAADGTTLPLVLGRYGGASGTEVLLDCGGRRGAGRARGEDPTTDDPTTRDGDGDGDGDGAGEGHDRTTEPTAAGPDGVEPSGAAAPASASASDPAAVVP